jgi:hypothetical protein
LLGIPLLGLGAIVRHRVRGHSKSVRNSPAPSDTSSRGAYGSICAS